MSVGARLAGYRAAALLGIEAWLDFFVRQTAGDDEALEVFGPRGRRPDRRRPARLTGPVIPTTGTDVAVTAGDGARPADRRGRSRGGGGRPVGPAVGGAMTGRSCPRPAA